MTKPSKSYSTYLYTIKCKLSNLFLDLWSVEPKRSCFHWPSWSSLLDESVHHLKQHLHEPSKLQELSVYSNFFVSRVSFFKTNYHRLIMFHCEKTWCAFVLKRSLFDTFHLNPSPLLEKSKDVSLSLQLKMRPYAEWILAVCDLVAPGHWQRHTQRWTDNQLSEAGKIRTWLRCAAETFHQLIFSAPCCDYREFPQPLAESSPLKQCQYFGESGHARIHFHNFLLLTVSLTLFPVPPVCCLEVSIASNHDGLFELYKPDFPMHKHSDTAQRSA